MNRVPNTAPGLNLNEEIWLILEDWCQKYQSLEKPPHFPHPS
jgi:hypothetical protein